MDIGKFECSKKGSTRFVSANPVADIFKYAENVSSAGLQADKSALAVVLVQSYCLLMLDWSKCAAVERIAGKVSGAWLFKDTRVPVAALFENLEDGATVDNFLEWFPGVTREQVEAVLEHAGQSLAAA